MKVKASKDLQFYRLAVLKVPDKDKPGAFLCEMNIEQFRALKSGEAVEIDKRLYDRYSNCFEVVKSPKNTKEIDNG
jgi:hypothetical protein